MSGKVKGQREGQSVKEDTHTDLVIKKQGTNFFISTFFQSTKDVIWKTKSFAKSWILDSQESFIKKFNVYMGVRDNIR